MISSRAVRVLIGLLVVCLVVLGITLLTGGSDDSDSDATTAAEKTEAAGGSEETGGSNSKRGAGGGAAGGSGERGGSPARPASSEPKLTENEKAAMDNAQRFYDILSEEKGDENKTEFDSAGFCELMSEKAREQTIEYARRSSGIDQEWNCENSVELLVLRSKRTGGFKQTRAAKVVGINVEGDRATATVRFGKGPLTSIPLVKEDGEWKLGASQSGETEKK